MSAPISLAAHQAIRAAMDMARRGETAQALAAMRKLVLRHQRDAGAHHYLGLLLMEQGHTQNALYYLGRAVDLDDSLAPLWANYGLALAADRQWPAAAQAYRRALAIDPGHAQSLLGLTRVLVELLEFDQAVEMARAAIAAAPGSPRAHIALGVALLQSGRGGEAAAALREACAAMPGTPELLTSLMTTLQYRHDADPAEVFALTRRAGSALATGVPLRIPGPPAASSQRTSQRVRVGYLSPDLRDHAVASFMMGPLMHHNRRAVKVICYGPRADTDPVSKRLRLFAGEWVDVSRLDDRALVQRIRADQIDVLVELSGHTLGNRLAALAHRPAQVQVSYLGYPASTGLPAVDYRMVDGLTDPPGAEELCTERLVRLDRCFLCYTPRADAPEVRPRREGPVTFGSFNALPKLCEGTLDLWARVMHAAPGSRLLLKAWPLGAGSVQERIRARFAAAGIDAGRLEFLGRSEIAGEHLGAYEAVDIALDPFPYNGTTTTCEALYMGVPVVTLAGRTHAGRVGVSLLTAAGVPEWIAGSPEEFTRIAAGLAADSAGLASLRSTLRARLLASALCDARGHAARLEAAYREMVASAAPAT